MIILRPPSRLYIGSGWRSSPQSVQKVARGVGVRKMANEQQPGEAFPSEKQASGVASSPVVLRKRGGSRASYKAAKLPYSLPQLILQVFETQGGSKVLSLAVLKKHLTDAGYNVRKHNSRLKRELNNLVSHGLLTRVAGTSGTSGLFRFSRQTEKKGKSEPAKEKKAAAAKKSPKVNREPQKRTQEKRRSTAKSGKNKRLNNHATGSNKSVPVKKRGRRK